MGSLRTWRKNVTADLTPGPASPVASLVLKGAVHSVDGDTIMSTYKLKNL
jgi:hypothetical protein